MTDNKPQGGEAEKLAGEVAAVLRERVRRHPVKAETSMEEAILPLLSEALAWRDDQIAAACKTAEDLTLALAAKDREIDKRGELLAEAANEIPVAGTIAERIRCMRRLHQEKLTTLRADLAARDRAWVESVWPGNTETTLGEFANTPERAAAVLRESEKVMAEEMDALRADLAAKERDFKVMRIERNQLEWKLDAVKDMRDAAEAQVRDTLAAARRFRREAGQHDGAHFEPASDVVTECGRCYRAYMKAEADLDAFLASASLSKPGEKPPAAEPHVFAECSCDMRTHSGCHECHGDRDSPVLHILPAPAPKGAEPENSIITDGPNRQGSNMPGWPPSGTPEPFGLEIVQDVPGKPSDPDEYFPPDPPAAPPCNGRYHVNCIITHWNDETCRVCDPPTSEPPTACTPEPYSTRVCERGTKCCTTVHAEPKPAEVELDSPNSVPPQLQEFAARGYKRINRHAKPADPQPHAFVACAEPGPCGGTCHFNVYAEHCFERLGYTACGLPSSDPAHFQEGGR